MVNNRQAKTPTAITNPMDDTAFLWEKISAPNPIKVDSVVRVMAGPISGRISWMFLFSPNLVLVSKWTASSMPIPISMVVMPILRGEKEIFVSTITAKD